MPISVDQHVDADKRFSHQLFNEVQSKGPERLFTESVPLSLRLGPLYAEKLVHYFLDMIEQFNAEIPSEWQVMEWGAGSGLTSLFFLDILKDRSPVIYEHTILTITDHYAINPELLHSRFQVHANHVRFQSVNASLSSSDDLHGVHFAYSNYLVDSLGAEILWNTKDGMCKAVYSSELESSFVWPLSASFGGEFSLSLSKDEQIRLLANHSFLAKRFLDHLRESVSFVKFDGVDSHYADFWRHYQSTIKQDTLFTLSLNSLSHLDHAIQVLHPYGVYVLSDFGFSQESEATSPDHLSVSYGSLTYQSTNFKLLRHYIEYLGGDASITARPSDQTQELFISPSRFSDDMITSFKRYDISDETIQLSTAIDTIQSLDPETSYIAELSVILQNLSDFQKDDFYFLKSLVTQLFQDGYHDEAQQHADRFIALYDGLALPAFLVKGLISQHNNAHQDAVKWFSRIIDFGSNVSDYLSLAARALSYCKLGNVLPALSDYRTCFDCCPDDQQWAIITQMIRLMGHYRHSENVTEYEVWVENLYTRYQDIVPGSIHDQWATYSSNKS